MKLETREITFHACTVMAVYMKEEFKACFVSNTDKASFELLFHADKASFELLFHALFVTESS
ncbi:MAG: hypothetical protein GY749_20300 [Desulfobacteraceae bacterium]|nr:hypothetical protein [Desulfobacteraceae bacterium]